MSFSTQFLEVGKKASIENIQIASRLLTEQGIRHVLVGTAGLALHGMAPKGYESDDIDFLVTKVPYVKEPLPKENVSVSDSVATIMDGIKVDFILTNFWSRNKRMRKYFTRSPKIIQEVPVADVADILSLKLSAARPKDFVFLAEWCKQYGAIPKRKTNFFPCL